jgi:hypothetical protein
MQNEPVVIPSWLKSKFFWLNVCAISLFVLNQILTNHYLPNWTVGINIAIVVVTGISNALAGTVTMLKLKAERVKSATIQKLLDVHTKN